MYNNKIKTKYLKTEFGTEITKSVESNFLGKFEGVEIEENKDLSLFDVDECAKAISNVLNVHKFNTFRAYILKIKRYKKWCKKNYNNKSYPELTELFDTLLENSYSCDYNFDNLDKYTEDNSPNLKLIYDKHFIEQTVAIKSIEELFDCLLVLYNMKGFQLEPEWRFSQCGKLLIRELYIGFMLLVYIGVPHKLILDLNRSDITIVDNKLSIIHHSEQIVDNYNISNNVSDFLVGILNAKAIYKSSNSKNEMDIVSTKYISIKSEADLDMEKDYKNVLKFHSKMCKQNDNIILRFDNIQLSGCVYKIKELETISGIKLKDKDIIRLCGVNNDSSKRFTVLDIYHSWG